MPKLVDYDDRRQTIARAAIAVIGEAGIEGARLRDVAKAASVTTGAVTHYFDGKDAVLEAALAAVVEGIVESIPSADTVTDDFIAKTADFLPHSETRHTEWKVWLAFWARAMADPRLRAQHGVHYRRVVDALADLLTALKDKGRVALAAAPSVVADAIIAAIDGLSIRIVLEPDDWPTDRQLATLSLMLDPLVKPL